MSAGHGVGRTAARRLGRALMLVLLCGVSLQLFWLARIALMVIVDPQSTTYQRSEIWRLLTDSHQAAWAQQWMDEGRISPHLKRAVIASEDAGFTEHGGVEWEALELAWPTTVWTGDKDPNASVRARFTPERDKPPYFLLWFPATVAAVVLLISAFARTRHARAN